MEQKRNCLYLYYGKHGNSCVSGVSCLYTCQIQMTPEGSTRMHVMDITVFCQHSPCVPLKILPPPAIPPQFPFIFSVPCWRKVTSVLPSLCWFRCMMWNAHKGSALINISAPPSGAIQKGSGNHIAFWEGYCWAFQLHYFFYRLHLTLAIFVPAWPLVQFIRVHQV